MRIPKRYGESREDTCPWCHKQAIAKNPQGVPTCREHKERYLSLTCACGEPLDIKEGKWGPFALCLSCGPQNMRRALETSGF